MTDADPPTDPLEALRAQVQAATAAAERLAAETAAGRTPPGGWATPEEPAGRQEELQALIALVEALRDLVPDELRAQVRDVLRQLLLLARAIIDWWVDRIEGPDPRAPAAPRPRDVPID